MIRRLLPLLAITIPSIAFLAPMTRTSSLVETICASEPNLNPNLPVQGTRSNPVSYVVELSAVVTPPEPCKVLKIWMPIPPSDAVQTLRSSEFRTFPMTVGPRIGREKTHGNQFAYFEFVDPRGAQMVTHRFRITTHEVRWNIDAERVPVVAEWPASFATDLRSERFVPTDERFKKIAADIVAKPATQSRDFARIFDWVDQNLVYSHKNASLQGSAIHALEHRTGHCSDYHGLCAALGRSLGYPARIVYGINPWPKNSPSHCKLEAFVPGHGWVCFDVSETQKLIRKIRDDDSLSATDKATLTSAAKKRLLSGFRDNAWFQQTRGSDYDLEPPARSKVAVVRTIYAEADGVPYPEPDPTRPQVGGLTWMTLHRYEADRNVINPFSDFRTLIP